MSLSSYKKDEFVLPWYCQSRFVRKIGYFTAAYVKINSDEMFRDFLEVYKHAILSGVYVERAKEGSNCEACGSRKAIKFHRYYFVLGFNFPMPRFFSFQEAVCSMKCALAYCSPNAVLMMVGFHNLSKFFDLDLIVNEFLYFFDKGHIEGVGQLRSSHRLFHHSSKWDHDWAR